MKKTLLLSAAILLTPAWVMADTLQEAFETHRAMYGKDHTFTWQGKEYSTNHPEELEARVEPTQGNATALLELAKAENKKAASVGYEWKLTRGLLKNAEAAIKEGEYQRALNLAAQAKYHARIGIEQHAYAEKNWQLSAPQ